MQIDQLIDGKPVSSPEAFATVNPEPKNVCVALADHHIHRWGAE